MSYFQCLTCKSEKCIHVKVSGSLARALDIADSTVTCKTCNYSLSNNKDRCIVCPCKNKFIRYNEKLAKSKDLITHVELCLTCNNKGTVTVKTGGFTKCENCHGIGGIKCIRAGCINGIVINLLEGRLNISTEWCRCDSGFSMKCGICKGTCLTYDVKTIPCKETHYKLRDDIKQILLEDFVLNPRY